MTRAPRRAIIHTVRNSYKRIVCSRRFIAITNALKRVLQTYFQGSKMANQTFTPSRWNLRDVLPATSGPEFDAIVNDAKERVARFETYRPKLSDEMEESEFLNIVRESEALT